MTNSYDWESSWYGSYYLPTNSLLIDHGNTNANLLGLYHFTTQTNQAVEGNSMADIGYHYVATDGTGKPFDSNGDGVPDYLEDANGDGLVDNGETNWAIALYSQPLSQTVPQGSNVTFTVSVEGVMPLYYQWYFGGSGIAGATNASLTLTNVQAVNVGNYYVVVTNSITSTNSATAFLGETVNFNFTNFCNYSALQLNGSAAWATPTNANCELELTPSTSDQTGTAFYKFPVSLSSNASFSTFFSFRMTLCGGIANQWDNGDAHMGADGITFIVQTLANTNGGNAGGLGYLGISNSAAVEFDTWYNNRTNQPSTGDPDLPPGQTNANGTTGDGNHVAIDLNGVMSNLAVQHIPDDMNNSNIWYAWVDYDGITNLQVRISETNSRPASPTIAYQLNLINYLQTSNAYVGFGAGTGGAYEQQDILSWQFVSPYNPIGVTNLLVTILSPTNATILARTNVIITAFATNSSPVYPVNWVQFFSGTNSIGYAVSTNGIFQLPWFPPFSGTNVLTALAVNTNGIIAWSAPVTNYVRGLPSVTINAPTNGEFFHATPTNMVIQATATADRSVITNVAFYAGTNLLGAATNGVANVYSITNLMTNGVYTLVAVATDTNGASGVSYPVLITIDATNQPPQVYAGPDQTNTIPATVQLNGLVTDDGLPSNTLTIAWSEASGPTGGTVSFGNSNLVQTTATFSTNGVYVLQLAASDGTLSTTGTVTVTMLVSNAAPVVFAGTNQAVWSKESYYPTPVQLQGVASDDGNPAGFSLVTTWSEVSGPGKALFGDPNRTNTIVTLNVPGLYDLRLTAFDGQLTSTSDVSIAVATTDLIAYRNADWKYIYEPSLHLDDGFEAPSYDDSNWTNGTMAFGSYGLPGDPNNETDGYYYSGSCADINTITNVQTHWPSYQGSAPNLLLRKHFNIPSGVTNLNIGFTVDNTIQVFLNGTLLTTNITPAIVNNVYLLGWYSVRIGRRLDLSGELGLLC